MKIRSVLRCLPLWLLLPFLFVPVIQSQDAACLRDDLAFATLDVSDSGLITFDDLGEGVTYDVTVCALEPGAGAGDAPRCDLEADSFRASAPAWQIRDWDAEGVYRYAVTGTTAEGCFISGLVRDYRPAASGAEAFALPTPTALPVLLPPAWVAFAPDGSTVTWDAVPGASAYVLEWAQGDRSPASIAVTDAPFAIPEFDASLRYSVTVKSLNRAEVAGPPSAKAVWTPPAVPRNLRINALGEVSWEPVADAALYLLGWDRQGGTRSLATAGQGPTGMQDIVVRQPVYTIQNFDPGADYSAELRAVTHAGAEGPRAFTTRKPPSSPDGLRITEFGEVTWNRASEASYYLLDWRRNDEAWHVDNQVVDARFTIPDFDAAGDYIAMLRTVNGQGVRSFPPVAEAWLPPTVMAPSGLKITSVGFVSWSGPDNADRYQANWRLRGGAWSDDINVDADSPLNFTNFAFDDSLEYEVRVRAEVDVGDTSVESGYSTQVWPMPTLENWNAGKSSGAATSDDSEWNWRIAPHNGASLIVWFRDGQLEARSGIEGASLTTSERCTTFTDYLIASSTTLEIRCTADNYYLVVEINPQHAEDNRRDLLYFDHAVSDCYRAYEYLATGEQEVWLRLCRQG